MRAWLSIALLCAGCGPKTADNFMYVGDDGGIHGDPDAGPPPDAGALAICPTDGGWLSLAPMAAGPRAEVGVAALNSEVYVAGGYDVSDYTSATVEAYSWRTNTWRRTHSLPFVASHVNLIGYGGKLYALGGLDDGFVAYGSSFSYDPAVDDWVPIASMPAGTQRGAAAMGIVGKKIVLVGGYRAGSQAQVSAYDPLTDMWEQLTALPTARDHGVGAVFGDTFFAIGGRTNFVLTGRVDALAMGSTTWVPKAQMVTARAGTAGALIGDTVIVAGGEGAANVTGIFPQVEAYNIGTDSWTVMESWPTLRHGTGGATIDGVAFFPGGAKVAGGGVGIQSDVNEAWCPAR